MQVMHRTSIIRCTLADMDVAVAEFRANLKHWFGQARTGEDVVITERGTPVVKIVGLETTSTMESLV